MFWLNSRSALVTATSHFRGWHPLSRSYGANLPSSLANVKPDTPRPSQPGAPVSDLGTDTNVGPGTDFHGHQPIAGTRPKAGWSRFLQVLSITDLPRIIRFTTATAAVQLGRCVSDQAETFMVQEY